MTRRLRFPSSLPPIFLSLSPSFSKDSRKIIQRLLSRRETFGRFTDLSSLPPLHFFPPFSPSFFLFFFYMIAGLRRSRALRIGKKSERLFISSLFSPPFSLSESR